MILPYVGIGMSEFSYQPDMVVSEGLKSDRLEQVGAIGLPDIVMSAIGSRQLLG